MSLPVVIKVDPADEPFDYGGVDTEAADYARAAAGRIRSRVEQNIIETGRDLIAVKQALGHGAFGKWLAAEFAWSERTARHLMSAAELAGKTAIVSVLPTTAIYKLAAPTTPEQVRDDIVERLVRGEKPTAKQIGDRIADARKLEEINREALKRARRRSRGKTPKEQARIAKDEERRRAAAEREELRQQERAMQAEEAARAAIEMLRSRLGEDFPAFLRLYATAGWWPFQEALQQEGRT